MFGYVTINKSELKVRELDIYQSFYCGLCEAIQKRHGFWARFSVNYDFTFLALLLSSLYEPAGSVRAKRCLAHPLHKRGVASDPCLAYSSDMNVFLSYLKCLDDWRDEHKIGSGVYALILYREIRKIRARYPHKTEQILRCMRRLALYERSKSADLDAVSGCFGELMRYLFAVRKDAWTKSLGDVGFYLGKFIYLMDAYEDLEQDKKSGSYNLLRALEKRADFEDYMKRALVSMMAECSRAFEYLPIVENVELLRNILYSGVWHKYHLTANKRKKHNRKTQSI